MTPERGLVFVNQALLDVVALPESRLIGNDWLTIVHPEDRARIKHASEDAARSDTELDFECRILRGDGAARWVRGRATPHDEGGATAWIGSVEDITDRVEASFEASRLSSLGETSSDFVGVADGTGRVQYLNPAARRFMGLGPDDPIDGIRGEDIYPAWALEIVRGEMVAALVREGRWQGELAIAAADGTEVPVRQIVHAERDEEGKIRQVSIVSRDVRESRALQAAASESDARFRALADSSPFGIIHSDQAGRVTYVNQRWREISGLDLEDAMAGGARRITHPDDAPRVFQAVAEGALTGRESQTEFRITRPDGVERWVRSRTAPVRTPDGQPSGYVATVNDITDEVAARRSADALVHLMGNTPDYASITDAEGRTLFMNRAMRELFGVDPDADVTNFDWQQVVTGPSWKAALEERWPTVLRDGLAVGESVLQAADGREVPTSAVTVAHDAAVGSGCWYSTIARDISDLKAIEARLARDEATLRAIVESSPLAIFTVDPEGTTQLWNASAERLFGWSASEVVGRPLPFADQVEPAKKAELRRRYGGSDVRVVDEITVETKDGSTVDIRISSAPIRALDGRIVSVMGVVADETERKRAQAELRRSEERFRTLVQHSADMVMVWDATGTITYVSPSAERYSGFRVGDQVGGRQPPTIHPDDVDHVTAIFAGLTESGASSAPFQVRLRRADGVYRWLEGIATNLLADVNIGGYVLNARDVTERVETARTMRDVNEALARSNETLSAIFENSPLAIYAFDGDGTILLWNPACESTYGWTEEEAVGRFSPVVREMDIEPCRALRERVMAGDSIAVTEARRATKSGTEIDVMFSAAPLRDGDGDITGVIALSADISKQKAAEQALRASEQRFRALVQNSSDIVAVLDPDAALAYASPSVERILGYPYGSWLGRQIMDIVHPDDRPAAHAALRTVIAEPALEEHVELRLAHADGTWRQLEVVGRNRLDDPAVAGVVLNARDVTERREAEVALRQSEARYRGIVEDQTEFICRYQPDGTLTFVNEAYARYFGFGKSAAELVGLNWMAFVPESRRESLRAHLAQLGPDTPVITHEHSVVTPDGEVRWQHWTDRVVLDERGNAVEYQAVGRDVTQRRQAEKQVADHGRILEMVAKGRQLPDILTELCEMVERHSSLGTRCSILLLNEEQRTLHHGAAPNLPVEYARAIDGAEIGPEEGSCGSAAYHARRVVVTDIATDPLWRDYKDLASEHGLRACWSTPIVASADDRVLGTFAVYYDEIRGPSPQDEHVVDLGVGLATVAVERKAYEAQLAYQAHHDSLTGLPNRMLFLEFLELARARARRFRSRVAVLFLDLDRFKLVNDSLGHDAGDDLLSAVAQRLRTAVRPGDTVARFGGDEFTILCEDLSGVDARQQAVDVAERLLGVIRQPFVIDGDELFLSASIGIAIATDGRERPEELLRDSDAAMYRAKERGKGRWELFDEAMRAHAHQRLETESDLHRAIGRDEFRVLYQPVLSLTDGRCVGAEALLRWEHPERGPLSPLDFVVLAEESGIIVPIGAWVLEQACKQGARWQATRGGRRGAGDEPFVVSVNLSGRQLSHPDTPLHVKTALDAAGLDPGALCLEITESVLMDDAEATMGAIAALKGLGVRLSIDDFGTGYSSLGYLKRFPVDAVKVDRSFVDGLGKDSEDGAIVAAVVSLGHALGLTVVAEGVETHQQLGHLMDLGCDEAQGFFFAPPRVASELDGLVTGPPTTLRSDRH